MLSVLLHTGIIAHWEPYEQLSVPTRRFAVGVNRTAEEEATILAA